MLHKLIRHFAQRRGAHIHAKLLADSVRRSGGTWWQCRKLQDNIFRAHLQQMRADNFYRTKQENRK